MCIAGKRACVCMGKFSSVFHVCTEVAATVKKMYSCRPCCRGCSIDTCSHEKMHSHPGFLGVSFSDYGHSGLMRSPPPFDSIATLVSIFSLVAFFGSQKSRSVCFHGYPKFLCIRTAAVKRYKGTAALYHAFYLMTALPSVETSRIDPVKKIEKEIRKKSTMTTTTTTTTTASKVTWSRRGSNSRPSHHG